MKFDSLTFGRALYNTWIWFVAKLILGTVVAYLVPRWMVFMPDGSVVYHWELYVTGAAAVAILWLISDVKGEYLRLRPNPLRNKGKPKRTK